jgi:hypothetical protein
MKWPGEKEKCGAKNKLEFELNICSLKTKRSFVARIFSFIRPSQHHEVVDTNHYFMMSSWRFNMKLILV